MNKTSVQQARLLLKDHFATIQKIALWTARRKRLHPEEAEDLVSYVCLKMTEDGYRVLRRFRGKSSLRTYLTVVIQRMALDYCTQLWGRWRPSAEAQRLGPTAIRLEQLLYRDGYTFQEAKAVLTQHAIHGEAEDLAALAARLPHRPRRRLVREESLAALPTAPETAPLPETESRAQQRAQRVLQEILGELPAEERHLLALHFGRGTKVSDIARHLQVAQRPLYTRIYRCLRQMRRALERAGIHQAIAMNLVDRKDFNIQLDF